MSTDRAAERNRLLLLGLLPSLVLLALAAQLVLLVRANEVAIADYRSGDHAAAYDGFTGLRDLGLVEPWVAPFNAGTAAYRQRDWAEAAARFAEALEDVPDDRECDVRVNLALAHEAAGHQARRTGSQAEALRSFRDARAALGGPGCSEAVHRRVDRRIGALSTSGQSDEEDERLSAEEKVEKLERLNEQARRERRDAPPDPTTEPDRQIHW